MARSYEFEAGWLSAVTDRAGYTADDAEPFVAAVERRLRKGAEEYGGDDAFTRRAFTELVGEAREEGEDFPGWLLLAIQRLKGEASENGFDPLVTEQIERILATAAAKVAEGWHIVALATELYEEHLAERVDNPK